LEPRLSTNEFQMYTPVFHYLLQLFIQFLLN
jgi:hypothetical protein